MKTFLRAFWLISYTLLLIACNREPNEQSTITVEAVSNSSLDEQSTSSPVELTKTPEYFSVATRPSPRSYFALAYDSEREVVVLFGGLTKDGYNNDTWEYDGNSWRQIETPQNLTPRARSVMAYDPDLNKSVLYGGGGANTWLDETWEYDGQTWQLIEMATPPVLYDQGAMAYSPGRGALVLFGGLFHETWQYSNQTWIRMDVQTPVNFRMLDVSMVYDNWRERLVLQPSHNGKFVTLELDNSGDWYIGGEGEHLEDFPGERTFVSTAFDNLRGVTILFGGALAGGTNSQDTWEYDGVSWRKVNPLESPPARFGHRMVFDESRGVIVLFGGRTPNNNFLNDTWEYDGTTWVQR